MPDKAYAIIYADAADDPYGDSGYIYFPIKRNGRTYGGMPQFFGGTKEANEADIQTIVREAKEESDGKITVLDSLKKVHSATIDGNTYNFYVARKFTGNWFLGPLDRNAEMSSIQKFLVQCGQGQDVEDLLARLKISASEEFSLSETYDAFDKAIKWCEKC